MAANEDVDEVLAALASMGFEFEDCHEALMAGHTNLETAVEWLIKRKPDSSLSSLPSTSTHNEDTSKASLVEKSMLQNNGDVPGKDDNHPHNQEKSLSSRWTMSEDAKKERNRFIEKERKQASIEAKKRKIDEKEVRRRVLKQIQDDKELRKAKSGSKGKTSLSDKQLPTNMKTPDILENTECLLKVRLPNGNVKTGKVSINSSLLEAIGTVSHSSIREQDVDILQPFPYKIFTSDELEMSLGFLLLYPSVLIVVQKRQIQAEIKSELQSASIPASMPDSQETLTPAMNVSDELPGLPGIADRELTAVPGNIRQSSSSLAANHGNVSRNLAPNRQFSDPDNEREESEVPDRPRHLAHNQHPPDNDRDRPHLPGLGPRQPQALIRNHHSHQWPGEGVRLGAAGYNPHAINPVLSSSSPGESALQRIEISERRLQHLTDGSESPIDVPHLHREVRRLEDLCIEDVALRVSGHPRLQPIASLGTLSSSICDKLLEKLMKNKALTPKAMNAFLSCCLRSIKLDCYLLVTNELLHTLRWHKCLTLLSLKSCPLINDKAMEALTLLKKLQSLNINQCSQLTDKCLTYIKELPSLTVLQMDGTKISDEGIAYFVSHANCAAKLTHLGLCSTFISNSCLKCIKYLKSLRVLELENTKINKLDDLCELKSLEILNVSRTQLEDDSIAAIRNLLSLKSLNLLWTHITNNGLLQLSALQLMSLKLPNRLTITDQGLLYIKGLPLNTLDLGDYINITDLGIQYISSVHSLRKLTLSNTRLTDDGLRSLSELVDLVELNLDRTQITDYGCAVVQNFQDLQILSLSSTHITNQMLLDGVLNCCIKLSQLNLSRTRISNKGLPSLSLPSLSLLNLDWTRVTFDCQILLAGCPCLKALRTNNCSGSDDEED